MSKVKNFNESVEVYDKEIAGKAIKEFVIGQDQQMCVIDIVGPNFKSDEELQESFQSSEDFKGLNTIVGNEPSLTMLLANFLIAHKDDYFVEQAVRIYLEQIAEVEDPNKTSQEL